MEFSSTYQPYASNRYCVTARNGMVATGNTLASSAGLEVLRKGGNAIDAAVATAAALTVVEPTANGLGSDAFALVWVKDQIYGLNSSGYSPKNISLEEVKAKCGDTMPKYGWTPVMVPGAVKGWSALVKRFGKLSLAEDLAPAIRLAEEGFPLPPVTAMYWERNIKRLKGIFGDAPEFAEFFRTFTKDGVEPYHFGEMVRLPNHAKTLRRIAETDGDAFYKGEIADAIVRQSQRDGGYFCKEDLSSYESQWVDPISVNYRGYDVWEIPPNGQGIVALMALNILKEFKFETRDSVETFHKQFEAIKLAFADAKHYVTDPAHMTIDYHDLLNPAYGAQRAKEITDDAALPCFATPPKSGTVYLCTADGEGNMVSYIQSNYMGFGSGIVIEDYGISMQNRGADFSLNPEDANALKPHKKSYHTIIPGFLSKDGKPVGPFGVMGGYMQPQGHLQVVMNMVDFHLNPQQALDAPRWQWMSGKTFTVEHSFDNQIARQLFERGHDISHTLEPGSFGRGEIIVRLDNGVLVGGCESRTDANISCY